MPEKAVLDIILEDMVTLIKGALESEYQRGYDVGRMDGIKTGFNDGYDDAIGAVIIALNNGANKPFGDEADKNQDAPSKEAPAKKLPVKKPSAAKSTKPWSAPAPKSYEDISVFDLGLTTKTAKALARSGINKVGELIEFTASDLASIPRFGKHALTETVAQLKKLGLELKS